MTSLERPAPVAPAPAVRRRATTNAAVANAVGRDLDRLTQVLTEPVTGVRRAALIGHLTFLLDQLRADHRLQDVAIWPAAVRHRPELTDMAERVARSHAELKVSTAAALHAAADWSRFAGLRPVVLDAAHELAVRLRPVLDQDCDLLPLACNAIPDSDWVAIERLAPRLFGPTRLARRMFWLLDELDPGRQAELLHNTPLTLGELGLAFGVGASASVLVELTKAFRSHTEPA